ncbi:MAG: hypothetical protein PHY93_05720 [Bacteriovorax sp.]|nr:hypothetical protein [Bacteriovorax sp.]
MDKRNIDIQENEIDKQKSKWRFIFLYPLALILLFEEWGWEPLAALFDRFARLPMWARLERQITMLPPLSVLFVFGVPVLALFPVKILAIYLFGKGHIVVGSIMLVSTKIFGTALCARLFQLTRPALMKFRWFSRWYPRWKKWKDGILWKVRQSSFWHMMQKMKLEIKIWWVRVHPTRHK